MSLDEKLSLIHGLMRVSLTDVDIRNAIPCTILLYDSLRDCHSIIDAFRHKPFLVILYPTNGTHDGHWTLVWFREVRGQPVLNFFCPYANTVDDIIYDNGTIPNVYPLLSKLVIDCPYETYFNEFPLQQCSDYIGTCGRHVIVRAMHSSLSEFEYAQLITSSGKVGDILLTPDEVVTILTRHIT